MGKKFLTAIVSTMMILATSVTAFAAEPEMATANVATQTEVVSSTEENAITPRSSISGYANGTVRPGATGLLVPVDSSLMGGAGATITTSASSTYSLTAIIWEADGVFGRREMGRQEIKSNGTFYFNNMWHNDPANIVVEFVGLQGSVNVQAWIYG